MYKAADWLLRIIMIIFFNQTSKNNKERNWRKNSDCPLSTSLSLSLVLFHHSLLLSLTVGLKMEKCLDGSDTRSLVSSPVPSLSHLCRSSLTLSHLALSLLPRSPLSRSASIMSCFLDGSSRLSQCEASERERVREIDGEPLLRFIIFSVQ